MRCETSDTMQRSSMSKRERTGKPFCSTGSASQRALRGSATTPEPSAKQATSCSATPPGKRLSFKPATVWPEFAPPLTFRTVPTTSRRPVSFCNSRTISGISRPLPSSPMLTPTSAMRLLLKGVSAMDRKGGRTGGTVRVKGAKGD